jgi:GYF domain 2
MYKIIGGDQREYGPVSADDVRRWIAEGRLNGRSLVQAQGSSEWKPLSAFAEFGDALGGQMSAPPPPLSGAPPADLEEWKLEILARPAEVRIGDCLNRAWALMTSNFRLLLGACAVIWGIGFCQFIPVVGLLYKVFAGVLYGGLFLIFLKRIRGENTVVNEVFSGFHLDVVQLVLAGFVSYILMMVGTVCFCILPGIYLAVAWAFSVPLVADKRLEFWPAMELSRKVTNKVWFEVFGLLVIALLPVIVMAAYGGVKTVITIIPLVQQTMNAGPGGSLDAMYKSVLRANLASLSLSFFSRLVLLVNMPFAVAALMYAYENLFGPRPAREA